MNKKDWLKLSMICVVSIMGIIFLLCTFILPCENINLNPYCKSHYLFFDRLHDPEGFPEDINYAYIAHNKTLCFYYPDYKGITLPEEYEDKIEDIRSMGVLVDVKNKEGAYYYCFSYKELQEGCILLEDYNLIETIEYERIDGKVQYKKRIGVIEILDFENPINYPFLKFKKPLEFTYIIWIPLFIILSKKYDNY